MNAAEKNQAIVSAEYAKAEKLFAASMRRIARSIKKVEVQEDATKAIEAAWKALYKAEKTLPAGAEGSSERAANDARYAQVVALKNAAVEAREAAQVRIVVQRDVEIQELTRQHREAQKNVWWNL